MTERETKLDDWGDWDYEKILRDNDIQVTWDDGSLVDHNGNPCGKDARLTGWRFYWSGGTVLIGHVTEEIARKASAMEAALWLLGVAGNTSIKLMRGYIMYLEEQDAPI